MRQHRGSLDSQTEATAVTLKSEDTKHQETGETRTRRQSAVEGKNIELSTPVHKDQTAGATEEEAD